VSFIMGVGMAKEGGSRTVGKYIFDTFRLGMVRSHGRRTAPAQPNPPTVYSRGAAS